MNREYKRDSTRGRAIVDPVSYKGDALIQCWIDRRKLATLSNWLDEAGYRTRTLADVLRLSLEAVVESLVNDGVVEMVELTSDAVAILDMKYKVELNPSGRGSRNLSHNLHLDERRKDRKEVVHSVRDIEEVKQLTNEALKVYEERYGSLVNGDSRKKDNSPIYRGKTEEEINKDVERIMKEDEELKNIDMSSKAVFGQDN